VEEKKIVTKKQSVEEELA
jgi:hypothetical protein